MTAKATIILTTIMAASFLTGCASVPTMTDEEKTKAIMENSPQGMARVYVYRDNNFGGGLYKDIYLDGWCLGESAPKTFFYADVEGGKHHWISTESEFSPNHLYFYVEPNKKYYFQQSIRLGLFVGGAVLTQVDPSTGVSGLLACSLAVPGTCSSAQIIKLPDDTRESLTQCQQTLDSAPSTGATKEKENNL